MSSRRDFLASAGLGALMLGGPSPSLWRKAAAAAEAKAGLPILVVVELGGGNDGLNTVVPFADDLYARARPTLRIEPKRALKLDDRTGLHPSMEGFKGLYDSGDLTVVRGVGYPDPNRSHFRSMEIWHAGSTQATPTTGWLGRVADANPGMTACHVGQDVVPMALRPRKETVQSVGDLADFRLDAGASLAAVGTSPDELAAEVRRRIDATRDRASTLEAFVRGGQTSPRSDTLRGRLDTIRALIELDPKLRVFYTSRTGFDTHAGQEFAHAEALRDVSSAVSGFVADLKARRLDERVLVLIFSEFGRRVRENAQRGTDHGAAGPVLLAGTPARGGLVGPPPDLADLDDGDVKHAVDFRDVYATVLRRWLAVDPTPILGRRDESLSLL